MVGTDDWSLMEIGPVLCRASEGDDLPAASMSASGQVTFSDVDASDTHSYSVSAAAAHGAASVDAGGNWSYTVSDSGAVDALAAGEHLADSFTVKVADNQDRNGTRLDTIHNQSTNAAPCIT